MENKRPQFIEGYWRNGQPKVEEKKIVEAPIEIVEPVIPLGINEKIEEFNAELGAAMILLALAILIGTYIKIVILVFGLGAITFGGRKLYQKNRERKQYLRQHGLVVNYMGETKVI